MARQRRSKSLEKVARTIKDSDEFVEHVFGIATRYRAQYELETGSRGREIRQAVKVFEKHAAALGEWLHRAQKSSTAEHEALGVLSSALHGSASAARPQAIATELWLQSAAGVSERALTTLKRSPLQHAPRAAAEALRATFEHHGLKMSYRAQPENPSDVIRLLCAIAKDSGDADMTATTAKQWLKPATGAASGKLT
ncbi:MAG: hypothetical protein ABW110_17410 [Steroidobacteraceae bacterium]